MACSPSEKARGSAQQACDPELDFFSPCFNPLRALLTAGLTPPVPAARPLDTVYHCRFMLPSDHPDAWRDPVRAAKSKVTREQQTGGTHPPRECPRDFCRCCQTLPDRLAFRSSMCCWVAPATHVGGNRGRNT